MNGQFAVLTVSQLNLYARSVLESDARMNGLFVRGEISNFTNHYRSGHFYLSLKDENSVIKAVMFRGNAQRLPFLPYDGMRVIAFGRASIYERDGQFQFYIDDMQPDGVGALQAAFEQLRKKLEKEGLFNPERKKSLPAFPQRIGVITSPTGAALQDILSILKRRWPIAEVIVYPVLVQGIEAPEQIISAIRYFNAERTADVLILGRGGGSLEELWAFNDENLARAVAASRIPIVSAVGHETDYSLCDFAADLRAPTPSAAAELISPEAPMVYNQILTLKIDLLTTMKKELSRFRERLRSSIASSAMKNPTASLELFRMRIGLLSSRAGDAQRSRLYEIKNELSTLVGKLDSLSPLKVLSRGYAIPMRQDGSVIKKAGELTEDEVIRLRLSGGFADCRVLDVKE